MLRLRGCVLSHLSSSPSTSPVSHIHRLLSATVPTLPVSPNPSFAVEDYLVDSCGLTRTQALKASAKLSHLKSPSRPDAVLSFLAGLGLSSADVAVLVGRDHEVLCAGVERTLAPNVAKLTGLGLSRPDIARLLSLSRDGFCYKSIVPKQQYYLPLFVSYENLLRALKNNTYLLKCSLDKVVKPNVVLLQECGLCDSDITKLCCFYPRMLTTNPERIRAMVTCGEGLGVPRGSGMFRFTLQAVGLVSREKIAAKVEDLKSMSGWSDAEVGIAVCKAPMALRRSKESLQRMFDFLISEMGFQPSYIARHPKFILHSLEGRIRPRHYVVKFLKENGLLDRKWCYNSIFTVGEKVFVDTFIRPHKEAAPHLAQDYATACKGEVPTRFIFASTKNLP